MSQVRRRVHYVGRVQGVGFRMTAARLAPGFHLSGFVRNLYDGSVELEAQGKAEMIDAFLVAIRGEMGSKIHSATESPLPPAADDSAKGPFLIHYR